MFVGGGLDQQRRLRPLPARASGSTYGRGMGLVRCTCVVTVRRVEGSWRTDVTVLDPGCDYVVHRAVAELALVED